jgi:hypothetical protein
MVAGALGVLTLAAALAVGVDEVQAAAVPGAAAPGGTAAYVPLATPERLFDSREGFAFWAGASVKVQVTGAAPRPSPGTAVAAVVNLTVVGPAAPGYWTVFPSGESRPNASNLNVDETASLQGAGLAMANLVTVPVGADGAIEVYASHGGHVVVDLFGYYTPSTSAAAGRLVPRPTPQRVLDTRESTMLAPGETRPVRIPGAAGAAAVALNVTVLSLAPGYWRVYAEGGPVPATSNINAPGLSIAANQVIVPVDADGDIAVEAPGGGHLVVDLVGVFTGAGAPSSTAGLFVPLDAPTRFLDTRDASLNATRTTRALLPRWAIEVPVASHPAVARADVSAVALNVTLVEALSAGYVSVTTAGANDPSARTRTTSTTNTTRAGQILANHAIVPVSSRGFDVFTYGGGHALADVAGYYVGAPAPAPFGGPSNVDPTPLFCAGFPAAPTRAIVPGSSPDATARVQHRLLQLGFWHLGVDGGYGTSTAQAVMAFQKWARLPATARVDEATATALNLTLCRPTAGRSTGDYFEVDKGRQIAHVVRAGQVVWTFNVSTGNGESYDEEDQKNAGARVIGVAVTPSGDFRVYREADIARYEGSLGTLYRPKFFSGGVAVHGAKNVPNYPASHGCVRVVNPVMDLIWAQGYLPLGARVWVHD